MIRYCINLCNKSLFSYFLRNEQDVLSRKICMRQGIPRPCVSYFYVLNQRLKSKNSKKQDAETESDSYENEDSLNQAEDKYTKTLKINVTSLRIDAILKTSLGIARNKIETQFYESKIRLNGEKIQKKSTTIQEGDEIDLIKGPDVKNPNFTNVARVEILSIKGNEDSISVKVKRCKSLAVDAYR